MNCRPAISTRQDNFKPHFLWLHLSLKLSFYNTYLSQILKTIEGEMTCCLDYLYCVLACVYVGGDRDMK